MLPSAHTRLGASNHDELLARCTLHSRAEILFQLRAIQKRKLLVNLDVQNTRKIVVTSVLAVNETSNSVILDSARGDVLNQDLLSGKGAEFITQADGVSISFMTGPVTLCTYDKLPALKIAVPKSMIRLQRREHFRVPMPIANPIKCIAPAETDGQPDPVTMHLVDLSCGGVALADLSGRIGTETGTILENCRLLLPDQDAVFTALEIRNSAQIRRPNGAFQTRLGCRFVGLPNDAAARLQRFILEIERARRNNM
ncbi:MAG: flagellar brake protein [Pseudomonadota bacterium]